MGKLIQIDIPSGDALIHCEVSGPIEAPVVVFLHGNGEDLHIFDLQIKHFSTDYKVVAIDTRGHGLSTRGTGAFNFHTFAADLLAVLDALHIDRAHIVGFSDGAIIALHTALLAPERISSMVLLGVNYNPKGVKWIARIQIRLLYLLKRGKEREIWGLMVHHPHITISEISTIQIPTLVVTGENDLVSQSQNDEISLVIKNSRRIVVPKGDHFWMFAQPELLNRYITDFLNGNIETESIQTLQS